MDIKIGRRKTCLVAVLVTLSACWLVTRQTCADFALSSSCIANYCTTDLVNSQSHQITPFIVHYFLLHNDPFHRHKTTASLSYLDCLSVLSVMRNLVHDAIWVHTNAPNFWPFELCRGIITNWTNVKLVPAHLKFTINGLRISSLQHEADIMKLETVLKYGGLALDFDVFLIDDKKLKNLLKVHPCVVCGERNNALINAGFLACTQNAAYPRMVLNESYFTDYRPHSWLYNSGIRPRQLLAIQNASAHILKGICGVPDRHGNIIERRGSYNWTDKIAYHSTYHDRKFTFDTLRSKNSTFGDLLNWILTLKV